MPSRQAVDSSLDRLTRALAPRYTVRAEVGRGGMATVYLGHETRHDRAVALKVFKPELAAALGAERFQREITLTARFDHPHILPLLDSGCADGFLYYVMPYVEGESLRDRLNREKQLPLEDAVQIAREVADALSYAHSLGILHRDIKPENILLAAGHARVTDFGIARAVTAAGGRTLTETGLAVGTPAYMSPEQASAEPDLDARTDVYSLGCVLYEMLTGEPPYLGATPMAILARKSTAEPPSPKVVRATVPSEIETAIQTALARLPADRYPTARQFADALERQRESPAPRAPAGRHRRIVLAGAGLVLALAVGWWGTMRLGPSPPVPQALAVLPFANLSGDREQDYFAYGMTEELIHRLAAISGLSVTSRTSVMRYRDSDEPLSSIAAALGVDALVEGSVSRSADSVRIRAKLVQARPERTLWSRTYDRGLRNILTLQSEVARAIAEEIGATVTPEDASRLARADTVDPIASEAYFKGRFYWNRRTAEDLLRAIPHFEQAIDIEPGFARAYAGLADAYILLSHSSMAELPPAEALSKARAAARQALERQDDLAEAHTSLAYVDTYEWNWEAAERGFQLALAHDTAYAITHFWYAAALAAMGRVDEAVGRARLGEEVDPLSPIVAAGVAWMLHFARRHAETAEQARKVLELEPGFAIGHLRLGVAYGWLGRYNEAVRELQLGLQASGDNPGFVATLARVYAAAGRRNDARRHLDDLLRVREERYVPAYSIATVHAALGDTDEAFQWLERAYEERSLELTFIAVEPELDVLRDDPRFEPLLRRVRAPH